LADQCADRAKHHQQREGPDARQLRLHPFALHPHQQAQTQRQGDLLEGFHQIQGRRFTDVPHS
jgi:hypothetical protein